MYVLVILCTCLSIYSFCFFFLFLISKDDCQIIVKFVSCKILIVKHFSLFPCVRRQTSVYNCENNLILLLYDVCNLYKYIFIIVYPI